MGTEATFAHSGGSGDISGSDSGERELELSAVWMEWGRGRGEDGWGEAVKVTAAT